ncbi:MAG: ATP-binding protein, partial [Limisphaerales bacterium]
KTSLALHDIIEQSVGLLADQAQQKGLEMILKLDPQVPQQVLGDPVRLQQILNNLLGNAIKFTQKGEIQVMVQTLKAQRDTHWVQFQIKDTGIGIKEEAMESIFEAFMQADDSMTRQYGGTGLGLAITRQLIELMHGQLHVESTHGKGSCFWFTLPLAMGKGKLTFERSTPYPWSGSKALILEPNDHSQEALAPILRNYRFDYHFMTQGKQAIAELSKVQRSDAPYRFVLVNDSLKDQAGIDFCQVVHDLKLSPAPTLILMTSIRTQPDKKRLEQCGIQLVVKKPIMQGVFTRGFNRLFKSHASEPEIEKEDTSAVTMHQVQPLSGEHPEVLVVEDNPVNQSVAEHMLKKLGFRPTVAESGDQALEWVQRHPFAMILMDCQMPGLDGYQTTYKLRSMERLGQTKAKVPIQIIAMTANSMDGDRQKCLESGMDDYIAKPVLIHTLASALKRAMNLEGDSTEEGNPHPEEASTKSTSDHAPVEPDRPTLDHQILITYIGEAADKKQSMLAKLTHLFVDNECPKRLEAWREALETTDRDAIGRCAHSLKGSAANMGAQRLSQHCGEMETRAQDMSREALEQGLDEALALAQEACDALKAFLDS